MYNTPRSIVTDQGRNFESFKFLEICTLFRVHKLQTTSYHPQSNGVCKRFNQTLKSGLRKTLGESQISSWDIYLNFIVVFLQSFNSFIEKIYTILFNVRELSAFASRYHLWNALASSQWRLKPLERFTNFFS